MTVIHAKARHIKIAIRRLPEGVYLATSDDVPGLTVEAETRGDAQRISAEVALDLLEAEFGAPVLPRPNFSFQFL